MENYKEQIAILIEKGKINKTSPFPPDLKGQDGADEITAAALKNGVDPGDILAGCMIGMNNIGEKFSQNKVFVPELLMAAKAMTLAMAHLEPFFSSGEVKRKGVFIVGTVAGDLHDIGKNLVAMVVKGAGWEIVDMGVDVSTAKFVEAAKAHPGSVVGLSALLTTTMVNMENTVKAVKEADATAKVIVGGAPLTQEFANKIGADGYSSDPQGAVNYLNSLN